MGQNKNTRFPFQYMKFPSEKGLMIPFLKQVENVLSEDLQKSDAFGCKINNCHTHAGSKIHFNDFIEAELLFHNSYYNKSFAKLTCDWIKSCCDEAQEVTRIDNILLIGYEKYSELYLQELNELIKEHIEKNCGYCVYETVAETQHDGSRKNKIVLRNFEKYINEQIIIKCVANTNERNNSQDASMELNFFDIKNTLCIFIVPINTTLSTMDKMVAKFFQEVLADSVNEFELSEIKREHICLITLKEDVESGSVKTNDYWNFENNNSDWIIPQKGGFEHLTDNHKIRNLVAIPSVWSLAKNCEKCYPSSTVEEQPVFGVNRGSVVPMLRVGTAKTLIPINTNKKIESIENLLKVCALSDCLLYKHTSRGENHYQYYLNTDKFIKCNYNDIGIYLDGIKDRVIKKEDDVQVFDFLVAPRHESNAEWVHLVHKKVFNGAARIIYFDVEKEYRSNLKAKYSDLICGLMNIKESNQKFLIRFHFVDDTVQSGANFLRAKNLITSLSSGLNNINIFESAFILINRLSLDTRKFYLQDANKFFYYVDVNISPMRSYEDACTLCKLIADYHNIRSQCATNKMAEVCTRVISRHKLSPFSNQQQLDERNSWSYQEKKLVFFITHLLNERLSNNLALEKIEKPFPIDTERTSKEIEEILFLYFNNGDNILKKYTSFCEINILVWKVAFVKAVSRPFFIYHIRQRQAAFEFCIKMLNELLDIDKSVDNCVLVQVLVKALADLNANYLIRNQNLSKLINYAVVGDAYYRDIQNDAQKEFLKKRLFGTESLLHYIKKDIVLSRDTTKSLLLEHVLVNNDESVFFDSKEQLEKIVLDDFSAGNSLNIKGRLYLENNVILKNGLSDDDVRNNLQKLQKSIKGDDYLYFFSNLNEIWRLNTGKELKLTSDVLKRYDHLATSIKHFAEEEHEKRKDLSKLIDDLFASINDDSKSKLQTIAFVYDSRETNPLFQFFTLSGNPAEGTEILDKCKFGDLKTSQAFFYDKNLAEIRSKLKKANGTDLDVFFIEDNLTLQESSSVEEEPKALIVRLGNNMISETSLNDSKISDDSLYFQIWGFDKKNIKHCCADVFDASVSGGIVVC